MKRRPRTASLRLVLEDARVDEILKRLREQDMVLVEIEEKLGIASDRLEALAAQLRQLREQPSLPFKGRNPYCAEAETVAMVVGPVEETA